MLSYVGQYYAEQYQLQKDLVVDGALMRVGVQ